MHYPTVKLGSIASFNPRRHVVAGVVAYVTPSMITIDTASVTPAQRALQDVRKVATHFENGDLLVASQFSALLKGKVAHAHMKAPHGFCSTQLYVVRADPERLHPRYLLHFLRHAGLRQQVAAYLKNDIGRPPPTLDFLKNISIPLPPLHEQQRIAVALDWAHGRCILLRRRITQCNQVKAAYFHDCFGPAKTLLTDWQTSLLGQTVIDVIPGTVRWSRFPAFSGAVLIQPANLGRNHLVLDDLVFVRVTPGDATHRTRVMAGDVLISTIAPYGRTAVAPKGIGIAFAGAGVTILRGGVHAPAYLAAYLASASGQAELARVRSARLQVTPDALYDVCVPLVTDSYARHHALGCDVLDHGHEVLRARLAQTQERVSALEQMTFGVKPVVVKRVRRVGGFAHAPPAAL